MSNARSRAAVRYPEAKSRRWLAWVARELQRRNATVFLIEDLQPACLAGRGQYLAYLVLSRVPATLLVTLIGVWSFDAYSDRIWRDWLGVAAAWSLSLVVLGATDAAGWWEPPTRLRQAVRWAALLGSATLLTWFWFRGRGDLLAGLPDSTFFYPIYGVVLAGGGPRTAVREIRLVESFTWSWQQALPRAAFGAAVAVVGFWFSQPTWVLSGPPLAEVGIIAMTFGALKGLRPGLPALKVSPNQGIRTTLALATFVAAGVLATIILPLSAAALAVPGYEWESRGGGWLIVYIASSVASWTLMHFGGRDVIRHGGLRLVLWAVGAVPLRLAGFLDYAAKDLQILQKVGGGYIFIHRLMLEHFARGQTAGSGSSATRSQPVASHSASVL